MSPNVWRGIFDPSNNSDMRTAKQIFRKGQLVWVDVKLTEDQKKQINTGVPSIFKSGYLAVVIGTDWPFVMVQDAFGGIMNELRQNVSHVEITR